MHDAAVASGLVRREAVLLLEQRHVRIGPTLEDLAGDRHADDAATDDGDPVGHRRVGEAGTSVFLDVGRVGVSSPLCRDGRG